MRYATYRTCERFGMLPPDIPPTTPFGTIIWDHLTADQQSDLLAYNQIREIEEAESGIRL